MDNNAVNNLATPTGKGTSRWRPIYATMAVFALTVGAGSAQAGPEGGRIVAGQGNINRAGNDITVISQQSHRLGIDWNTFNVAANESVVFQQPGSSSIALNRILDHNPSQILGAIDANGQVFLINPSGIIFGESARVNLHSIVASSLDISTEDFMSGNYDLKALSDRAGGLVVNRGLIQAASGGSVTLVGGSVANEGLIVADYGQVNLAAGKRATLDFDGDRLMLFEVSEEILENSSGEAAAVSNSGTIEANGGQVLLTGSAASDVFGSVVNNSGVIRAGRIENVGGVVRLVANGGTVLNSGDIDASGTRDGGRVELLGERVGVFGGAHINADGETGGGTVLIGGGYQGADPDVMNADRTFIGATTTISADATDSGDGGTIIAWSDEVTRVYGNLSARGGAHGGDGGFVETSSKDYLDVRRTPDVTAPNGDGGTWLIDPDNINIVAGTGCVALDACPPPVAAGTDFTTTAENATLGVDLIQDALQAGSDVVVMTADISMTMDGGNITWDSGATLDYNGGGGGNLTLQALNDIIFDGAIADIGDGVPADAGNESINVFLLAGGNVTINGTISLLDGTLNIGIDNLAMVAAIGGDFTFGEDAVFNGSGMNVYADGNLTLQGTAALTPATMLTNSIVLNSGMAGAGSTVLLDFAGFTDVGSASATGGDGVDLFTVAALFGGDLNGGLGGDTFTLATVPGMPIHGTVTGTIDGGGGPGDIDTLVAADRANTWTLTGPDAGTVTGVTGGFTEIDVVQGGAGTDTFTISGDFAGDVNGGGSSDTIILATNMVMGMPVHGTVGGAINAGGQNGDRLVGADAMNTWVLDGPRQGTVTGVGGGFTGIATVQGGGMTNNFTISGRFGEAVNQVSDFATAGFIVGGNAADTFTFEELGAATSVRGNNGIDTLQLADVENTVTLTGSNVGTVSMGTSLFNGFYDTDIVTGGMMNDVFTLAGSGWSGAINGGDGNDMFNLDFNTASTAAIAGNDGNDTFNFNSVLQPASIAGGNGNDTFNFQSGTLSLVGGAPITVTGDADNDSFVFSGGLLTGSINGGTGTNSLTAANQSNMWALNAAAAGTVNDVSVGFLNIANVIGGAMDDQFAITEAWAGNVNGGDGIDTFTISTANGNVVGALAGDDGGDIFNFNTTAGVTPGSVSGGMDNDIFNFNSGTVMTAVSGNEGDDDFNINVADAASAALNGDDGADDYVFADGASLTMSGMINGGADSDTINWSAYTSALALTLTNSDANGFDGTETLTNAGGFVDVEAFLASMVASSLTAPDTAGGNTWVFDGVDDFTLNTARFTGFGTAIGGSGGDIFTLMTGGSLSGSINGMGGTNRLNGAAGLNNWVLNGPASGTLNGITGGFSNITIAAGGSMVDNFDITGDWGGNVTGGANTDFFTLNGGTVGGTINGNGGSDTLVAGNVPNNWALTAATDGTVTGVPGGFSNIEVATGNGMVDSFIVSGPWAGAVNGLGGDDMVAFAPAGSIGGMLDGGAGSDSIDWTAFGSPISFTLALNNGGFIDGFAGSEFTTVANLINIDVLMNFGAADTFTASNLPTNTWLLNGTNDFNLNGTNWLNWANVNGGTMTDNFTVAAAWAGNVTGGDGADTFILSGGSIGGSLDGNGGADTLTGANAPLVDWTLAGATNGTVMGITGGFSNIDNVVGGSMADTFTITGMWGGNVSGGEGMDAFNFTGTGNVAGVVSGDAGDDSVSFAGLAATRNLVLGDASFTTVENYAGNGGSITGENMVNAWMLDAAGGSVTNTGGAAAFTGFGAVNAGSAGDMITVAANNAFAGTVTGGIGADQFVLLDGASITGALDGGTGTDTLNWTAYTSGRTVLLQGPGGVDGQAGTVAMTIEAGFDNIDTFATSGMDDTLVAPDSANTWLVNGADTFLLNNVSFTGFANLTGNSNTDDFTIGVNGMLTGAIDGGMGVNTLTGADAPNMSWTLAGATNGTVAAITNGFSNIDNVMGGSMADTFTITGMWAGNVSGGAGLDVFNFTGTGNVAGVVSGDAGDDSVSFAGLTATRNLVLGDGSFTTVENYAGNGGSITGENMVNAWMLDAAGGSVTNTGGAAAFTGFGAVNAGSAGDMITVAANNAFAGTVTGGIGADQFVLLDGASITGALDGGTGTDTLNWTAYTSGRTVLLQGLGGVDGQAGTVAMTIEAGFDNIDTFATSGMDDTLVAPDSANTWLVNGADTFLLNNVSFTGFANLTGNSNTDDFTIGDLGMLTGAIDGGMGVNTLTGRNMDSTWNITGPAAGSTGAIAGGFVNIAAVTGGTAMDTFNLASDFTGSLNGGDGADDFNLLGGTAFGELNGGAGSDTLTGSNAATAWLLGAAGSGTVGGQAFTAFEAVVGRDAVDTVTIDGNFAGTVNTGGGDDNVTLNTGGAAISIVGGLGIDTLTGTAEADAFVLAAIGAGTVNGGVFAEMENLDGSGGNDEFTVDAAAGRGLNGTIRGGAGDDELRVDYTGADSRTLTFAGGAGMDTVVVTGGGAGFSGTFGAASGNLNYTGGGNTQTIAASEIERIDDTVFADSLTVNGTAGDDVIELGTGMAAGINPVQIAIAGVAPIDSANKTDLVIAGGDGSDSVNIASNVALAGSVELNAETVSNGGGSITAALLRLVNTSAAGVGTAIQAVIDTLQITGGSGNASIADAGDLVLAASDSTGNVNLTATGGNITQSGALAFAGNSSFAGTAITLANAGNDFGGAVALAGGNATIVDQNALTLSAATLTGNLNATAGAGNLSSTNALTVGGTTGLIATAGNIVLSNAANSFTGALTVSAANNATINAASALALGGGNVGGNYTATSAGNIAVQQLLAAGGGVALTAGGTLAESGAGAITGTSLTATSVGGMDLGGANAVATLNASNANGNIAFVNTAGNLNVTSLTQSGTGTTDLSNTGGLTLSGAVTAGSGAVTLDASQSIAQNSNITVAGGALMVTAETGISMQASASSRTQGGNIGYCTQNGDVLLALLDAGSGNVDVKVKSTENTGGIFSINGFSATNIVGTNVTLDAQGAIGSREQSITIDAPGGNAGLITYLNTRASQLFVSNKNNTREFNKTSAQVVDFGAAAAIAAFQAGQSSSLQDVGFVDLALFSPDVTLINTVGTGMLMPCDQMDDEEARCQ